MVLRGIRRKKITGIVLAFVAGGLVALLAMPVVPAVKHEIGPASLTASARLGAGRTILTIPPLGTVSARTHLAPLALGISLAEVDLASLGHAVGDPKARAGLVNEMDVRLRTLAGALVVRILLGGIALGLIVGLLLPHRRWPWVAAAASGGLVAAAAALVLTAVSFDVEAFREPRFTGALTRAPVVLDALAKGEIAIPQIRSRYQTAAERLSDLLVALAEPNPDPRAGGMALLHISDIHSNPLGMEIALQLARRFEVDAVLDTGDLMSYGLPVETGIGSFIEDFGVPYLYVPGNHDSNRAVASVARLDNVTVLDGESVRLDHLEILGWRDPTYTNWNLLPVEEANQIRLAEGREVAERVAQVAPDVLAVHDPRLAEASFSSVPLVLAGHDHRRRIEMHDSSLLLAVGSTGATGIKSFTVDTAQNYEAEIVYLRDGKVLAVDYVTFTGLGSDFVIERTTFDEGGSAEGQESRARGSNP